MIGPAIPRDSNIKNRGHEKTEKYQGLKERVEQTWKVKSKVVPVSQCKSCNPQIGRVASADFRISVWSLKLPACVCVCVLLIIIKAQSHFQRQGLPV